MAEDAVDQALEIGGLKGPKSVTENLAIHGSVEKIENGEEFSVYGADADGIRRMIAENPESGEKLHEQLPYRMAEIVWTVRHEMAESVEDVLARRTRALFLNARAALEIAPRVARIMARETGRDEDWIGEQVHAFQQTAQNYLFETNPV
jgi:glycerol-3-phosphate dehydrogenase